MVSFCFELEHYNFTSDMLLIAFAIMIFGAFLILRADRVARGLKTFYRNYPLIRYANDKQFETRRIFIIVLGITFLIAGLIALLGIL